MGMKRESTISLITLYVIVILVPLGECDGRLEEELYMPILTVVTSILVCIKKLT